MISSQGAEFGPLSEALLEGEIGVPVSRLYSTDHKVQGWIWGGHMEDR